MEHRAALTGSIAGLLRRSGRCGRRIEQPERKLGIGVCSGWRRDAAVELDVVAIPRWHEREDEVSVRVRKAVDKWGYAIGRP